MMMNLPCLMVSCTNFLRSICSYTECQLSFQTGSCPTERTTASYSSCLYLIVTDLLFYKDWFSVDAFPCFNSWSYCWCSAFYTPSWFTGFLSRTLSDFRCILEPDKVLVLLILSVFLCSLGHYLSWSYDISQQFLRIICCPLRQDCKNHPQYFTSYHNQWLHLFQWIIFSRRIVHMEFFEFLRMCHRRLGCLKQPISKSFASSVTDFGFSSMLTRATCYQP